jgi:hypothetical protein
MGNSTIGRFEDSLRIPDEANAVPKGSRTVFQAEAEHHRSVATAGSLIVGEIVRLRQAKLPGLNVQRH